MLLLATATLMLIPALAYADVPVATISGPVSVAEGESAVYTVTLEGGTGSEDIVFDYTVTGTVSEADYTDAASGKLTLSESGGTTPATGAITLPITADTIDEVPETLIVTLTDVNTGAGTVVISPNNNSVTTTVLPASTETVSLASATAAEGDAGGAVFTVTLSDDIDDDVSVRYEVLPGTASRSDYTSDSASGTVTITTTTATFPVMPVDDNLAEDTETFTVRLTLVNPPNNVALGVASATGTITDNDTVMATVTANPATIVEGSVATFTVDLGGVAGSEDVVVTYNTEPVTADTSPAGSDDYDAPDGTLVIPAGATMGSIAIQTHSDDLQEGVETLRVTLTAARSEAGTDAAGTSTVGLATTATDITATTDIGDPDSTILVSVEDGATTEGKPAELIVRLSGKVSDPVTVPYLLGGGTAAATDYTNTPTPVVIPAGMTTGTIAVPTTDDKDAEDDETFTVTLQTLTDPPAGVALGDTTATATIEDDDPLTVSVTGANRVREGDVATFTVTLNGGMGSTPITVEYTISGTATKGTDYVDPEEKTLVINPEGSLTTTSATIPIQTRQDSEADETLVVTLTGGVRTDKGRVTPGTPRVARTTLVSQDTVIITVADAAVVEGATPSPASFVITVSGERSDTAKLRYETAPGTATAADYTAVSNTQDINIGASPTNDPITVAITNDSLAEGEETFTLNLSLENAPNNVVLASSSAKATISDDGADALSVSVASEEGSVEEGSDANFPVTLRGTSTADVVVMYAVAGSSTGGVDAAEKEDYEVPGDSLTIPAGSNTATITIPIVADDLLEPDETLQVTLMSPTTAKGAFADPAVTGDPATTVIIPQAQGTVTASLATTAVTVTEGGKALFPVVLSGKVAQDLTFGYSIEVPGTPTPADAVANDYSIGSEVEIKAGETRAVIEVNTTPDKVAENTETFTLTLALPTTSPPAGLALGTDKATGTIIDNDPINVTVEGPDRVFAGGSAGYRFRLTGDTTASTPIAIAYSTTNGTGASPATIVVGESVSAAESVTAGTSGSLVVRVTGVTTDAGRVASGVGRSKSTQIRPTDTVIVSIANAADVDEDASSSPSASFTVSVEAGGGSPTGSLTVQYQVVAGSATTADFGTPSPRPLVFTGTSDTITVPVVNDEVAEGDETFSVRLTGARDDDGAVELGTTTGTAKIEASDDLTARVTSQDMTVLEGESATFVVDLGGTSSTSVEIDYTVAGATVSGRADVAADDDDFTPENGKLTIPAGRRTGTIQIEAVDDDILEPNEGLEVTLSNPSPSIVFSDPGVGDPAQTVIGANGSTVTASLATTAVTVTEGGKALFPVVLSGKVAQDLTFGYSIEVPGTPTPADAVANDYSIGSEVEIKAGETRAVIEVNTTPDKVAENTETFTLTLALPTTSPPAGLALGTDKATGTIIDNDPINVTVEGPDRVFAGGSAGYRFRLTGDTTASTPIAIAYSTTNGTGASPATIVVGESVSAAESVTAGTSGSLVVRVTGVTTDAGRVASGVGRSKSTQIRPTDTVIVSIANAADVDEDASSSPSASFTVSVEAGGGSPTGSLTVQYQVVAGSATTADFGTPSPRPLVFTGTSDTITVPVVNDEVAEGDETFSVRLTGARDDDGAVELGTTTGTAKIEASDDLTARVTSQDMTVLEGESATFVVDLGGTSSTSVEIDYTVAGATVSGRADVAADDDDFTPENGKLTIPAGRRTGTIQIEAVDDDILEPNEGLEVTLSNPSPSIVFSDPGVGDPAQTVIGASDSPARVSVADVTVDEGDTAMIEVKLSKMVSSAVTMTHELAPAVSPPAASATDDYGTATPTPLTFMPGETAKTIEVPITQDMLAEDEEKFTVRLTLSNPIPAGVSLGRNPATVTITDDALTVSLSGDRTVNEGEAAEYTVSVSGFTGEDEIIVRYTVESDTATSQDYSPSSGTLTLNSEQTSQTFTIQTVDEPDVVDLREKLVVSIEAETSEGDPVRTEGPITTTIVDDGTVEVSVEADPEIVPESREEATFTVTLRGTVGDEPVTLDYRTADGTATAPADYTAANGTITIAAGDSSAIITVVVNDDDQEELTDEAFDLTLSAAALPDGVEIETATATVTITDHALQASVSAPTPATVNEGDSVTFTVSLTPEDQNRSGVAVDYALGGSAVAPGDYAGPASGTLTIPVGQDSGTVTISTEADGMLDPDETLSVTLSNARTLDGGLATVGSPTTATVTIVDQQIVTWAVDNEEIDESQDAVFTVTLDGMVQDDVTLTYETADGTAMAGEDYTAITSGQVTVAGGSTSAKFTVQVTDDSAPEGSETFTVQLTRSTAPTGVVPQSATATATIRDNDIALEALRDVTVAEGEDASIELKLDRVATEGVVLSYEIIDVSAISGSDYTIIGPTGTPLAARDSLPVPPGFQAVMVTVRAIDDRFAEGEETFRVRAVLGTGGTPREATVTITDNDELSVSVTAPKTVDEGDVARFTVSVGGGESTAPVDVAYSLSGTAKAPADYSAPSRMMVSVPAGQPTATITIQTKADKVLEADETLVVTLESAETANGSARVGSPKSATTRIQDPVYHSINRVNQTLLPGITRASAAGALDAVSARMALAAQGDPPAARADMAGLTGLYRALLANERAVQDGSYDLAQVLGGSSFLVPLSSHDGAEGGGIGGAVWGGGDFRQIAGGASDDEDSVEWGGSVWSARLGADLRFIDSLLTGLVVSWTSGGLDYTDELAPSDREGTYASWLISAHPYVGWSSTAFGLWATGGFGFGGISIDDADEAYEAEKADLTQWSLGAGGSVTLLSTDGFIAGGVTDLKLKADGFLAGASVAENEDKTITKLDVSVNQARAAIEASHAQFFADGGSLKPSVEIGGRLDGGDGETGAGLEVGGGVAYADPGSGLTVAAGGRALVIRDGNYGEWGLSGLIQLDPNSAGHGLSMSVRPTIGVTASGVNGLWEHGTLDLLSGSQSGGRVEAEIGYGLPAFGMTGVLTPFAGAALTDAGAYSLSVGGRLELGPAFGLILEAERSESADPNATPEHDVTLEGSFRW